MIAREHICTHPLMQHSRINRNVYPCMYASLFSQTLISEYLHLLHTILQLNSVLLHVIIKIDALRLVSVHSFIALSVRFGTR